MHNVLLTNLLFAVKFFLIKFQVLITFLLILQIPPTMSFLFLVESNITPSAVVDFSSLKEVCS